MNLIYKLEISHKVLAFKADETFRYILRKARKVRSRIRTIPTDDGYCLLVQSWIQTIYTDDGYCLLVQSWIQTIYTDDGYCLLVQSWIQTISIDDGYRSSAQR
ncbi:hypothetical protein CHS0354_026894 [Potamilus streckersoni]|uniref:Uncharacterized protein n=1 Tax=Potamilus streckersoni TaxID=2493646 RepID=A0AAE0SPK6_9BIVA|nr:hypothetical protein CHS0354_026894 [Potamilus streckersoni]